MNKLILGFIVTLIPAISVNAVAATNDNPKAPENIRLVLSDDYSKVTVSWDAVGSVGESGGTVDTSKITYYIFDAFGSYYDPAIAVTTDTSYTFDYSDITGQDFVAYQITAGVDEIWYSLPANSSIVVIGEPSTLPVVESFANGKQMGQWAINPDSQGRVNYGCKKDKQVKIHTAAGTEYLNAQDGDNGFFYIQPQEKGATFGFFSTKISLGDSENPYFSFYYQGIGSELQALVGVDGGELTAVKDIKLLEEPAESWTEAKIDLTPYKDNKYIQIGFNIASVGGGNAEMWNVALDNICVANDESGIAVLKGNNSTVAIVHGGIILNGDEKSNWEVYTLSGQCISAGKLIDKSMKVSLPAGIYVVRCGGKVEKVIIR